ncbi:sugar ABC transporter substrate-binding protein [Paenibacillus validus]|uniref:ABC transporter substrate-binding protein n=1 Tax=Paenibacillus validus TaxID=44253 RepID=UPI000FDB164B|nr:sugar ABC transporter substrate-binding protein [Paenibacillus validus]MED4599973.1 sugar ABC transporter substrate-binding protein [Paenibacillus validus]MED4605855.1 sugar ABC transporter substrate-binding protein [Paenibacillus validus]
MRKSFKFVSVTLVLVMLALMSLACGKKDDDPAASDGKKNATLDFVWFSDGVEGGVMKDIIKDYEGKNPNIKINLIEIAYKDLSTKMKTMVAGGKPPALARISTTEIGAFSNQALDLATYVGGVDKFTEQFIDSIKPYYVVDNKVIAAPMDVTANGLIYNKTLFDKAGVKVPTSPDAVWTWDEFSAALKQVMEKGGAKYGMVWDFTPHRWSTLLYQFGGSMISQDGTKATINNEAGVQAAEYFKKLHKDGVMPISVWLGGENPNNLFRSGTVAAHLAGNWMVSNYKDITNFEWGVTYMPKAKQRSSVPGGKFVMAFKNSGVEKEAASFIEYLSSKEVNSKFNKESLFMSPRKDSSKLDYAFGKEMFEVFANELNNTAPAAAEDWSKQGIVPKFSNDLKNNLVEVITDKSTAKEAMDKTAKAIDKAISDDKKDDKK